jgi:hypothetical protein
MVGLRAVLVLCLGLAVLAANSLQSLAVAGSSNLVIVPKPPVTATADDYTVSSLEIVVPKTLESSEANLFRPNADIVWRGEPLGDRHAQVKALFEQGFGRAIANLHGPRHVIVKVVLLKFHGITEKARALVGGIYWIEFKVSVRDARTGERIRPDKLVRADLRASGRGQAIRDDVNGRTEKVVVTARLADTIRYVLQFGG